jgi:hypothetical protein
LTSGNKVRAALRFPAAYIVRCPSRASIPKPVRVEGDEMMSQTGLGASVIDAMRFPEIT